MKILLVSTYYRKGGAAISSARIFEALRKSGIDVKMLVRDRDQADEKEGIYHTTGWVGKKWLNFLRMVVERISFIRVEKSKIVRFLFSVANAGEDLVRNRHLREADIIHLHWINFAFLSLRSLKRILRSGKPVVWTFHDMWAFTGGCHYALDCTRYHGQCSHCPYLKRPGADDLSSRLWKKKEKLFRENRFIVVTPSEWLCDCTRSSALLGHMDVKLIRYSLDQTLFKPAGRETACRNLGIDPAKKYILFGAAAVRSLVKGFDYFLEAARILERDLGAESGVEILLFGKTRGGEEQMFPLPTRNIAYISSVQTLVELYSAAHLFALPSLQDNSPNTIIESLLCGTPVVGFRTSGVPEMFEHLENGYVAEYKSSEDLARGMRWVLESENYEALSAASRQSAVRRYSMERAAEEHVILYNQLLKSGS
jgi:glycosyltransferase involved in cell wall biosynthesis